MAIDKCDYCRVFECQLQNAIDDEDDEMEEEVTKMFQYHMKSASWGYKANKSLIKWCFGRWRNVLNVHENVKILPPLTIGKLGLFLPWSPIHITIDWDKDRNELQRQFKRFYGSIKPQFISLNIKMSPDTEKGMPSSSQDNVNNILVIS